MLAPGFLNPESAANSGKSKQAPILLHSGIVSLYSPHLWKYLQQFQQLL